MNVGMVCRRRVVTIDHGESPVRAAELMRDHHVGALVVTTETDAGPHVVGIVTDRDLVVGGLAGRPNGSFEPVGDLASRQITSVSEDDEVSDAVAVMQARGVRRLLVTDTGRRLVGFVSLDDLIDTYASELEALAQVIRSSIERESSELVAHETSVAILPHFPATGTAGWQA